MEHYFTNNETLESELRLLKYNYAGNEFIFYSDNGVFSKTKIDYGSQLLIDTIIKHDRRQGISVLDLGCGYGFLGIILAKVMQAKVNLVDINKRAVHLTKRNISENNLQEQATCFESDAYQNITSKYDLIVVNPPIRAGKETVYTMLSDAQNHLTEEGNLWFVIRKNQGAKSTVKYLENSFTCEIIEKNKGFYVIKAKKR